MDITNLLSKSRRVWFHKSFCQNLYCFYSLLSRHIFSRFFLSPSLPASNTAFAVPRNFFPWGVLAGVKCFLLLFYQVISIKYRELWHWYVTTAFAPMRGAASVNSGTRRASFTVSVCIPFKQTRQVFWRLTDQVVYFPSEISVPNRSAKYFLIQYFLG